MSKAKKFIGGAESLNALQGVLNTNDTENTPYTEYTQDTRGGERATRTLTPPETKEETAKREAAKKKKYRVNLALDADLESYLHNIAWQNRTSITQYIAALIRKDKEEYFANGGATKGWVDHE